MGHGYGVAIVTSSTSDPWTLWGEENSMQSGTPRLRSLRALFSERFTYPLTTFSKVIQVS